MTDMTDMTDLTGAAAGPESPASADADPTAVVGAVRPDGTPPTRVALLGTGAMGYGMAVSLLRAGLATTVWNRTRAKAEPLAQLGAVVVDEPADAVRDADVVLTVLFDADAVADVMAAALPAMPRGAVWLQCATVGAEGTARLAALAEAQGVAFIDAPVLGTRKPALAGRLVVLAAGPDVARPLVAPVLDAIGERTVWVADEPGAASRLKLVANAWIATLTAGVAQSVALARAWDLDPQLFLDAIDGGAPDSPYAHIKGAAMLSGDFEPQFQLDGLRKDLALIVADARRAGVPTALVDTLARAYATAAGADDQRGGQDIAAVIDAFRPTAATEPSSDAESRHGRHAT